jgi:hypothetical protein
MPPIQPDMQCSWFPELWMHNCCVAHDLGGGDLNFFSCILEESWFLISAPFFFAVIVTTGMIIGRPIRHKLMKRMKKDASDR